MDKYDKLSKIEFIENFRKKLKYRNYSSTITIATSTTKLILELIKDYDINNSIEDLINLIKIIEKMLISVDIMQFTVGNITKRILHCIYKEKQKIQHNVVKGTSMVSFNKFDEKNNKTTFDTIKLQLLDDIDELNKDLDDTSELIKERAIHQINENDIILTTNFSEQILELIMEVAKFKKITIVITESYPTLNGIEVANKLSSSNIKTIIISDSAIFSIMPKVNKVLINTRAIMANGGLISYNGVYNICLAALSYSIPVIVACASFKLTPMYPFDHETYNEQFSPDTIYFSKFEGNIFNIIFNSPSYNYIPPEFISLFISDRGDYHPSYIYRLFNDIYSQQDY